MRRLLTVILVVGTASAAMWADQIPKVFNVRIAATDGKAAAKLPVFISTGGAAPIKLGETDANGRLRDIALDPTRLGKKYNAYRRNCTEIIWHEVDTDEDKVCRAESDKLSQSKPEDNKCGSCAFLGPLTYGESGTVGTFSGGHTVRNTAIAVGAGLTTLGVIGLSSNGGAEGVAVTPPVQTALPPAPAPNPFVSLDGTYPNVIFVLQQGSCAGFNPQFTGTITVTGHSSDAATAIVRIVESIVREYRGVFRNRIYEGTGSGTFASGRPWTGQVSFAMADGSVRNVREVVNVGASATSPACPATYAQP